MKVNERPKPHGTRYPWDELFKLSSFVLKKGSDYHGASHGMASTVRQAAARFKVQVNIEVYESRVVVYVGGDHDVRKEGKSEDRGSRRRAEVPG